MLTLVADAVVAVVADAGCILSPSRSVRRVKEGENETPSSFPAVGLRGVADWVLDAAAGGELSFEYAECFSFGGSSQKDNVFK